MRRFSRGDAGDAGTAIVEFVFLAVLLMVPLAYVVVAAATVQRAAFGVTTATREAGRAFVTATAEQDPYARAAAAADLALRDQGLDLPPTSLQISCVGQCGAPESSVHVALDYTVAVPLAPRAVNGRPLGSIVVRGRHTQFVDAFRDAP
ncbi:MAG: hypothetical protein M3P91_04715 [Actinomycetota bacterium]|nr:hypothetical protein [Actinomycetota bacterium]